MSAPNPLSGTGEDFTDADWKEAVEARHPGGFDHFSGDGDAEASLVSRSVTNEKLRGCLRMALGYQSVSTSAPFQLLRTPMLRHPRWTGLRCTNASARPFAPPNRAAVPTAPSTKLKRYVPGAPAVPTFSGYTDYAKAEVVLRFEALNYEVTSDENLTRLTRSPGGYTVIAEWERFSEVDVAPRVEQLSLDGFQLLYAEGTGAPAPYSNPQSQPFPAPFAQLLVKTDVTWVTHRLPNAFFFTTNSTLPRNILAGLGKVNRYEWNGYPAGTLLFLVAKLERKRWALTAGTEGSYLWKMTAGFSYFNPTKGYTGGTPTQITTNLGHNNMPWRGSVVAGDLNAGKWFAATRTGSLSDPGLLETFDIAQVWSPVGNALNL